MKLQYTRLGFKNNLQCKQLKFTVNNQVLLDIIQMKIKRKRKCIKYFAHNPLPKKIIIKCEIIIILGFCRYMYASQTNLHPRRKQSFNELHVSI